MKKKINQIFIILFIVLQAGVLVSQTNDSFVFDIYVNPAAYLYAMAKDQTRFNSGIEFGKPTWGKGYLEGPFFIEFDYAKSDDEKAAVVLIGKKHYPQILFPLGLFAIHLADTSRLLNGWSQYNGLGLFIYRDEANKTGGFGFTVQGRIAYKFLKYQKIFIEPHIGFGGLIELLSGSTTLFLTLGINTGFRITP